MTPSIKIVECPARLAFASAFTSSVLIARELEQLVVREDARAVNEAEPSAVSAESATDSGDRAVARRTDESPADEPRADNSPAGNSIEPQPPARAA